MKQKINILINDEARRLGLYYGFWNWFFLFKKELYDQDVEVKFFSKINEKFFNADHLFLNSRSFENTNDRVDLEYLKKIYLKNHNLYWFDMRDSAGTTQFEVLPYVKKYIKKQFYKDKKIYNTKLEGGRFYTDYYIKKLNIKDNQVYSAQLLDDIYLKKLLLGWNLGTAFFFDYINFTKLDYFIEYFKFKFFNNLNYSMKMPFYQNWIDDDKKLDFISMMNTNFYRNSVAHQRVELQNILNTFDDMKKIQNKRISKKKYYNFLRNSKVCISAYGWGEICYRDFESVICGVPFMTADMSNIVTWPDIYKDGETYISYDYDFNNLRYNLDNLIKDINLRKRLVNNSQLILKDSHAVLGKKYFIEKIFEIIE